MSPGIFASALLFGMALLLTSCEGSQKIPTILGKNVPGISDLDSITKEDREEASWWDTFYGRKPSSDE